MRRPLISVVILTCNEEVNLPPCLDSLAGLDCEIFVVDSGSTDATLAIAEAAGASVARHPFENYAAQRNWALASLPFAGQWLLQLDADERLTPALIAEMHARLAAAPPELDGFLMARRTIFLGRWIRHGGHYPVYHLRLFRKGKGACEERLYDQHFVVPGRVARLQHDYLDVVSSSLRSWTLRHVRWAELEADELSRPSAESQVPESLFGNPIGRRRWLRNRVYGKWPLFLRPFAYWSYRYFLRLGFLDGKEGLVFHFLQGFWFRFLVDSSLLERRKAQA